MPLFKCEGKSRFILITCNGGDMFDLNFSFCLEMESRLFMSLSCSHVNYFRELLVVDFSYNHNSDKGKILILRIARIIQFPILPIGRVNGRKCKR